jgi:hypothetical protein
MSRCGRFTFILAVLPLLAINGRSPVQAQRAPASTAASGNVPAAACGPGSLPETALQGEVPLADQLDGRALKGYSCNLELVGKSPLSPQYRPFIQTAFLGNCAFLSTVAANIVDSGLNGTNNPLRGAVLVQDFSDPAHPRTTAALTSPAFQNPWESLKANDRTGLIGAVGVQADSFDLYRATPSTCAHPTLEASVTLPDGYGHGGAFSPDGRFYYATDPPSLLGATPKQERMQIVEVRAPTHPRLVLSWIPPVGMYIHDLVLSSDGRTAYLAINGVGEVSTGTAPVGAGRNGLLILDTSQIENGTANPQLRIIGQVHWSDADGANQVPALARIAGKPYAIVTDEGGNTDFATAHGCPLTPPLGYPRIISIANPAHAAIVGTLRLQIEDPANCASALADHVPYPSHYCAVDNPRNTTAVACTYWGSGLRVFDIRDPARPREIAYYNPAPLGPSALNTSLSTVRFDARDQELWFSNQESGVQIVKFTNHAYPLAAPKKRPKRRHR